MDATDERLMESFAEEIARVWDISNMPALNAYVKSAFGFNSLTL
jgi:hypothetical protein